MDWTEKCIYKKRVTAMEGKKMLKPKWFLIAKNEYRIRTSSIHRIRPYFPYVVIGILAVYILYIAPTIVKAFINKFIAFILSQAAVAAVEIMLFSLFCYFIIIPISSILREEQTAQLHIFLKAPIKSSDVLLGTFMGEVPFYAILITVITGFFTALLFPLEFDMIQITITIIIFVVISLSAFWIGTVIAALLRTKLGRLARGKDVGRALAFILVLPVLALYFALVSGGLLETLADPEASGIVRTLLSWLPTSWGADVIFTFVLHPGDITAVWFETVTRLGGLLAFFVGVLWLGTKAAGRAYSLEAPTFIGLQAKPDGLFYKTVKLMGGGQSFGTLLVSIFKDFSRNLENLLFAIYILGTLFLMIVYVGPTSTGPDDPPVALMMTMFMFPFIVVMLTGDVTGKGKETLYIYRKAPSGEGRFIKAMLLKSWLMGIPLAGAVTALIIWSTMQATFFSLLATTGLMMLFIAAFTAFVLGLFLLNPVYSEKSVMFFVNIIIAVFCSMGLFAGSLAISLLILTGDSEPGFLLYVQSVQTALCWLLGILFLHLGKRKLSRMEWG